MVNTPNRRAYFLPPQRRLQLLEEFERWQGTAWRHAGVRPDEMKPGICGDCLFWVDAFKTIGAIPSETNVAAYRRREALRDGMQRLRHEVEASGCADLIWERGEQIPALVDLPPLMTGDLLLFKQHDSGAHCGIIVSSGPSQFVHLAVNGLLREPMNQSHYLAALAFIYRVTEAI